MNTTHDTTVQDTILEQLQAGRVNGFPFFAYTGIKNFVAFGEKELKLSCPRNPGHVKYIIIALLPSDTYRISFYKKGDFVPFATVDDVYFDHLVEIIVKKMGVN
jgi:hypothetical protein